MNDGDKDTIEARFVDLVNSVTAKQGKTFSDVAREVWPDKRNPPRVWQAVRTPGESRRLRFGDAWALCHVLGISLTSICAVMENDLEIPPPPPPAPRGVAQTQ